MDSATFKFHEALPYVLLRTSPHLSALHRSRTKHSAIPEVDCCNKCGSYLYTGDAEFRSIRPKRRLRRKERARTRSPNIFQVHCHICGELMILPLEKEILRPVETIAAAATIKDTFTTPPKTSTTKSKLQAMLLKTRETEQIERAHKSAQGSQLAAFLSTLP